MGGKIVTPPHNKTLLSGLHIGWASNKTPMKMPGDTPIYNKDTILKGKRIAMAVTNDLVTDQRVHRSCMALREAGADITLVGRLLPGSTPVGRPYKTIRMRLLFRKKAFFYAEYNLRLLLWLLRCHADLLYANDTDTLPAVYLAARLRHKPIFFDAHEMFPEVPELAHRPRIKAVWERLEGWLLPRLATHPHGASSCTVCHSIARHYEARYGTHMAVVRNVPMPYDRASVAPASLPWRGGRRLLLYQGAVNVGRGIEWVIDALPLLDDCMLMVIGTGDIIEEIRQRVRQRGVEDRVRVMGRLPLEELRRYTVCADLGLSLLENRGLNYYYALPNRIADFVQAHVPVLATDFPEMHHVVATLGIGDLVADGETKPEQLAQAIRHALNRWHAMPPGQKEAIFSKAKQELSWTHDKTVLLRAVGQALHPATPQSH